MRGITRRRALKGIGAGAILGTVPTTTSASRGNRVFVHPKSGRSRAIEALEDHGGRAFITYDRYDFVVGEVPGNRRGGLERDDRISLVENDGVVRAEHHKEGHERGGGNNGGGNKDSCDKHESQSYSWGHQRIGADLVTDYTGVGVPIGILDSGIDTDHCDLTIAGGEDFTGSGTIDDEFGHGSHCAGIAAADDNEIGVAGVAPDAELHSVKVLDSSGSGYWSWIISGIEYCINHEILTISMSFGAGSMPSGVHTAIEDAFGSGLLLVSSAGNEDNNQDGSCEEGNVTAPADHPDVIAVSAMDKDDNIAAYSSVGPEVEIMAPGSFVYSTENGNSYGYMSGTSMACPFVSGVSALCWEGFGDFPSTVNRDNIRNKIVHEGHTEQVLGTCEEGVGLVDAKKVADSM